MGDLPCGVGMNTESPIFPTRRPRRTDYQACAHKSDNPTSGLLQMLIFSGIVDMALKGNESWRR